MTVAKHRSSILFVPIAIVFCALAACARQSLNVIPGPFDYIPARWVDLPEAPFAAEMYRGKALLVARANQFFSHVVVGCVTPVDRETNVIANLIEMTRTHGFFGPNSPVEGVLPTLNNPEVYAAMRNANRCPGDSYLAITKAIGAPTAKPVTWSAQGTKWR